MCIELRETKVKVKRSVRAERNQGGLGKKSSVSQRRDEMGVLESTPPQTEVVMETPVRKQAVGFGKVDEARLDGKKEGKGWSPGMKSATKEEWSHHSTTVPTEVHIIVTGLEHANLKGRSVQPGGLWANVLESSFPGTAVLMTHPTEQRDRWVESLKRFPRRLSSVSISNIKQKLILYSHIKSRSS